MGLVEMSMWDRTALCLVYGYLALIKKKKLVKISVSPVSIVFNETAESKIKKRTVVCR